MGPFFISGVDTAIDAELEAAGTGAALALRGRAGIAHARMAHAAYEEVIESRRWRDLGLAGANTQRPLWASRGVKNPAYRDTMYVTDLVTPGTVNTMPASTLTAMADHGELEGDTVRTRYADGAEVLAGPDEAGVDLQLTTARLEEEGLAEFEPAGRS